MKINIASTHRFHLLDLARELSALGHDVKFYSYVPTRRCESFGLDRELCHSMLWFVAPFFVAQKIVPRKYHRWIIFARNYILDLYLSIFMRHCDLYISLGVVYSKSIEVAKREYNAVTILEWGSKHLIEELKACAEADSYPKYGIKRVLDQYNMVDYISIPSDHVLRSFLKHGVERAKLLVNPYGVDMSQFAPTRLSGSYDIIMVGTWSFRKGCDLLTELCATYGYSLLHVGGVGDIDFPHVSNMTHIDSVDQKELRKYYSQAKVFVLPSRTEGLAMVLVQAIVCGLPIVCSRDTGGEDLKGMLSDGRWIINMQSLTVEALREGVEEALSLVAKSQNDSEVRHYAQNDVDKNLSWRAYGERYDQNIKNIKIYEAQK